jgi:hypothetical protein
VKRDVTFDGLIGGSNIPNLLNDALEHISTRLKVEQNISLSAQEKLENLVSLRRIGNEKKKMHINQRRIRKNTTFHAIGTANKLLPR